MVTSPPSLTARLILLRLLTCQSSISLIGAFVGNANIIPTTTSATTRATTGATATTRSDTCDAAATTRNKANMTSTMGKLRSIEAIMLRPPSHWVGDGFKVYPVFAEKAFSNVVSPFLMFDYAAPKEFPPRRRKAAPLGVGQHPHRGFETVTVSWQGEVEHHDSSGEHGVVHPGDVQWMTAGRGIIHQEYHSKEFTQTGGTFEMAQLWVNLPAKHKMTKPRYQPIVKEDIPVVSLPLKKKEGEQEEKKDGHAHDDGDDDQPVGSARIIAGQLGDAKGPAKTFSPVQLWDVDLPKKGAQVDFPFAADQNCIVFVRRGGVKVITSSDGDDDDGSTNSSTLGPQDVALMNMDGTADVLRLQVTHANSSVLIMGGEPINEPIAARGPFVMNTQQELSQAMRDYQNGKMGRGE